MIDRIFSGAVTRGATQREGKMSYTEFVWFLIAEEDKRHPTAIEYWYVYVHNMDFMDTQLFDPCRIPELRYFHYIYINDIMP